MHVKASSLGTRCRCFEALHFRGFSCMRLDSYFKCARKELSTREGESYCLGCVNINTGIGGA
eukprot:3312141-Pyramimonas_sp.AAC.1